MHQRKNPVRIQTTAAHREPMGEQRYQQLLAGLGELFAQADEGAGDKRLAAIAEIREQMARHGLTPEDLSD